jgi:hypothetical protein
MSSCKDCKENSQQALLVHVPITAKEDIMHLSFPILDLLRCFS